MSTAAEIIASINELSADERAGFVTAFQNDGGDVVKAARSKVFAAGKREGASAGTEAATKLADAEQRVADLETELADVKAKTPDAAAIEQRVTAKLQPKIDAEKKRADDAATALKTERRKVVMADFTAALTSRLDDGTQVDPEWVRDVAETRWGNRIATADDGSIRVLQLDGEMPYDAPDAATAVKLLAADARKAVPARYVLSNTDSGAGITTGAYGRSGSVATVAAIAEQKRAEYSL